MNEATPVSPIDTSLALAEASPFDPPVDTTPPMSNGSKIGLTIAGGLALGLVVGSLWPQRSQRKIAKKSRAIMDLVSEVGQLVAAQTLERATAAAGDGREKLDSLSRGIGKSIQDTSNSARQQAQKLGDGATDHFHDVSKAVARTAVKLVEKARR
jgi:hypothetical protein